MKLELLAIITLLLSTEVGQFPKGERKNLKKGERWNVYCLDMEITVRETTIQTGEKKVFMGSLATIECNTANKAKAYFTCPEGAEVGGDPPEVWCR